MKTENLYTTDCIRTFTGQYVNVFNPDPETINIYDIAHALSMQPRFGGHLPEFYSVAEHSLFCTNLVMQPELKLATLLHDASEAYLLDIPRPIKNRLENYKEIENSLMILISEKFGFQYPFHEYIKEADEIALQTEWNQLMLQSDTSPFKLKKRRTAHQVEMEFLATFFSASATPHTGQSNAV